MPGSPISSRAIVGGPACAAPSAAVHVDALTGRGLLRGIAIDARVRLRGAHLVAPHNETRGDLRIDRVLALHEQRQDRPDSLRDDRASVHVVLPQVHLTSYDAGDVEKVVDEVHHVPNLSAGSGALT